jgi:uncharacterized membrane protein
MLMNGGGSRAILIAVTAGLACGTVSAQPRLTVLGLDPLKDTNAPGGSSGLSSDGHTVLFNWFSGAKAGSYLWTKGGAAVQSLGDGVQSAAYAGNGQAAAGYMTNTPGYQGLSVAAAIAGRWTAQSGWIAVPPFANAGNSSGTISTATNITADGRFIVGQGYIGSGGSGVRAFIYDAVSGVTTNLGNYSGLSNKSSSASDVSDDGTVVVGWDTSSVTGLRLPAVWTLAGGTYTEQILTTSGNPSTDQGEVFAINGAGAVIVGSAPSYAQYHLIRWTLVSGAWALSDLGAIESRPSWVPPNYAIWDAKATGLSDDGNTIVGSIRYAFGSDQKWGAFIWTPGLGIKDLYDYLDSLGTIGLHENFLSSIGGGTYAAPSMSSVCGISTDGQTVVGAPFLTAGMVPFLLELNPSSPLCTAPIIAKQAADASFVFTNDARLFASAFGSAPMTFQWARDNVPLSDGPSPWDPSSTISGSGNGSMIITHPGGLTCLDQGHYTCTFTNGCGSVTTAPYLLHVAGCCYANCDLSTASPVLNVADFTCFLQQYAAGAAYANCDGSTSVPVLNVADFTCFLQKYAAGCP